MTVFADMSSYISEYFAFNFTLTQQNVSLCLRASKFITLEFSHCVFNLNSYPDTIVYLVMSA